MKRSLSARSGGDADTDNVISLDQVRGGRGLSPLRQAEAYWAALGNGGVPRRSQIDPRGLQNILEFAFILERIAPGLARFRLAGQHLAGLAGMDARGMPLSVFFDTGSRNRLSAVLEHVFEAPAVAEMTLGAASGTAQMLLLPLRGEGDDVNRALGMLVSDQVGAARFSLKDIALRPVSSNVGTDRQGVSTPTDSPAPGTRPRLRLVT